MTLTNKGSLIGRGALAAMCAVTFAAASFAGSPQTTHDGLELRKHTELRTVYVKPGATFDEYKRIYLVEAGVMFKKNYRRDHNRGEIDMMARVTTEDMDRIKKSLAAHFRKIFTEELEKSGYTLTTETAEDVLIVRPAIINLDVTAPDKMMGRMNRNIVSSAGQMTLYLELYDAATSDILARVLDPEAAQDGAQFQMSTRSSNTVAADHVIREWAKVVVSHLDAVTT